jgi:hypothetical protein
LSFDEAGLFFILPADKRDFWDLPQSPVPNFLVRVKDAEKLSFQMGRKIRILIEIFLLTDIKKQIHFKAHLQEIICNW